MRTEEFLLTFTGLTERLDRFFHSRLRQIRFRKNIEQQKDDLVQDTFEALWRKLRNQRYHDYDFTKLIMVKANDVWIEWCDVHIKKTVETLPVDDLLAETCGADSPMAYEKADHLDKLMKSMDDYSRDVLLLHGNGFKNKEIADQLNKSENSIKTKISRMKSKFEDNGEKEK